MTIDTETLLEYVAEHLDTDASMLLVHILRQAASEIRELRAQLDSTRAHYGVPPNSSYLSSSVR